MTRFLKSPVAMFAGIGVGILIGLYAKFLIPFLSSLSDIYLSLLQMCALPIVACTICINIGSIFSGKLKGIVRRWVISALTALVIAAVIGIGVAFLMRDYMTPDSEVKASFARMQNSESQSALDLFTKLTYYGENAIPVQQDSQTPVVDFLLKMVPSNIFSALANGQTLQVIFFFCVLGIMMTKLNPAKSASLINAFEGIYNAMCEFISRLMTLLPFAMCAMLAVQFSSEEMLGMAGPLFKLILVTLTVTFMIMFISFIIIRHSAGCTLKQHWQAVKRTLLIAFGTRSCLASIPVAIEDCPGYLGLDRPLSNAVLPIGITMCQTGVIASGAVVAVFATTIYRVDVNAASLAVILIGSIFFSISTIGVPGVIAVNMLGIMLDPLGVPSDIIVVIFLAIIPVIDPFCVFASIYSNFAITSVVVKNQRGATV